MDEDVRASAERGIDFSSCWFADQKTIVTIRTTDMLPVDLNSLLYHLEMAISKANLINKHDTAASEYRRKAIKRGELIDKYFWNKARTFYTDFNFRTGKRSNHINPAGMYPFCFMK